MLRNRTQLSPFQCVFNIHRASTYLRKEPRAKVSVVRSSLKADPEHDSFMTFITSNVRCCKGVFKKKKNKKTNQHRLVDTFLGDLLVENE